ncbi:PREDICTED: zinc transporter 10 [Chinchilla lanigera]|nr:PREDICTED: zinc transporter 10 [Chinchilla lanigera]
MEAQRPRPGRGPFGRGGSEDTGAASLASTVEGPASERSFPGAVQGAALAPLPGAGFPENQEDLGQQGCPRDPEASLRLPPGASGSGRVGHWVNECELTVTAPTAGGTSGRGWPGGPGPRSVQAESALQLRPGTSAESPSQVSGAHTPERPGLIRAGDRSDRLAGKTEPQHRARERPGRGPDPAREKGAAVTADAAGDSLNTQNEPEETVKKKKSEALNIRGVLLHVMGDALGSVIVVVTAVIFYVLPLTSEEPCNWQCYIDPSLTVVMVIIILSSAFPLLKETATILLQMVPPGVNMEELVSKLSTVPGVSGVHELHVWELVSGKIIATLHIKLQEDRAREEASKKVREIFHHAGVHSVTIQFESVDSRESSEHEDFLLVCSSPCVSQACADKLCCPPGALPLAHVNGCAEHNGGLTLESYRSRRDPADVAIEVPGDGCLGSDHAEAPPKAQEDQRCENSTHF